MSQKNGFWFILVIFIFFMGFSLAIDYPSLCRGSFFSDGATYYSMAHSIAYDGDIEYNRIDLFRVFEEFRGGPIGIFLKKNVEQDKIFFSKSFIYPLFCSPFVRLLGTRGFFFFHSLLLLLVMYLGYTYLLKSMSPSLSLGIIVTFVFAAVGIVYFFWLTPEIFNLTLIFAAYFLWSYKQNKPQEDKKHSFWSSFLYSANSDYLASLLIGLATFSKPTNALFIAPLGLFTMYKRRWLRTLVIGLIFVAVAVGLFSINYYITGDWNYQGGYRKTFLRQFPLIDTRVQFEDTGLSMTTNIEGYGWFFDIVTFSYNIFYYFLGRYSGIIFYYFPAIFGIALFLLHRKNFISWLIFGTAIAAILANIIVIPDNYLGGGGTIGNRYFVNIYPLFFFIIPSFKRKSSLFICWIVAGVFLAQILLNPLQSSLNPAQHGKHYPFKLLPAELTQLNDLPINTNPRARKVALSQPTRFYLYFLDDNTYFREAGGFWIRGCSTAELILRSEKKLNKIIVTAKNSKVDNEVKARIGWHSQRILLKRRKNVDITFNAGEGLKYAETYLYRITIASKEGFIPKHYVQASPDNRYLGCFITIDVE